MSESNFIRPGHRAVHAMLSNLGRTFLEQCHCYFGGGTRIVLELGEYRESKDIDFLCSSREGYRLLREEISETTLGRIAKKGIFLVREIRADQYGIRTWLGNQEMKIKFEIVREARIDLSFQRVATIPVSCLDRASAFAEKFLANADRGLDSSTLSRDVIDLAHMIEGWSQADAASGIMIARGAYGSDVDHKLAQVTQKLRNDKRYRSQCIEGLMIATPKVLMAGLEHLARAHWPSDTLRENAASGAAAKGAARKKVNDI